MTPFSAPRTLAGAEAVVISRLPGLLDAATEQHGLVAYSRPTRAQVERAAVPIAAAVLAFAQGRHTRQDHDDIHAGCLELADAVVSRSRIMDADVHGKRRNVARTMRDTYVRRVAATLADSVTPLYRELH